jgi:hypothetical protein
MRRARDTVYRERAGGRWQYFTYSDGSTVYVSEKWALAQERRGGVRIVG